MRDGEVLSEASERIGRGHAERLAPMVIDVLAAAALSPPDIDRLAVCTGPGSFTGLRVALSYAKGFALPRRLPVLGFDRLSLALADAPDALVLQDIRRGEVMVARHGEAPAILSAGAAEDMAKDFDGPVLRDPPLSLATACRLAQTADPDAHPARAVYGRAPDAKLPGGIDPAGL